MKKVIKLIHKRLDQNLDKNKDYKRKCEQMKTVFERNHLSYKSNTILDFFQNEIIYQGIRNKQAIENAYFEARNTMNDYYSTLDYSEKQRLMNYETQLVAHTLVHQTIHGQRIYIPFFDEEMNRIYEEEMVLFDLKKYNYYVLHFDLKMIPISHYKEAFYNDDFCSGTCVYSLDANMSIYRKATNCLYFFENEKEVCHLSFNKDVDIEVLIKLSTLYFQDGFLNCMEEYLKHITLKERDVKKINKYLSKEKS